MLKRIAILAQDEPLRLLSTRRGLVSLIGFLLIWVALLNYVIFPAADIFNNARDSGLLEFLLPRLNMQAWDQWPTAEMAVYWVLSLYLLPFLSLLTSADQTATDRTRGTLRFLVMRCSRLEIFAGRFLGQCVILTLVILTTLATVLAATLVNSPDQLPDSLALSPMVFFNLLLLIMPYVALMALVSVMAKSARQATMFAIIIWLAVSMLVAYVQASYGPYALLDWVLPGSQVRQLMVLSDWQTLALAPIPIVHTIVLLAVGGFLMRRRDL